MISMQCPDCGYEADYTSVFCPQCRFQFWDIANGPPTAGDVDPDLPESGIIIDESIFEESQKGFSDTELKELQVQLVQPAVLVVLIVFLFIYTAISAVPFIPLSVGGLNFGVTGIVSLAWGLGAGLVFFIIAQRSLWKFRSVHCPECDYEADYAAVFCPQCRFRFRDINGSVFKETLKGFSEKELRQLQVHLVQPAVLVVLVISLFTYTVISNVPFAPLTVGGLNFGVTGIICLACGLVAGLVFFTLARGFLRKFRYR